MPHYANGEIANVGDVVVGKTYNQKDQIIGVIVHIKAGDTCNAVVAYDFGSIPGFTLHGFDGTSKVLVMANKFDYTEVKLLTPVKDFFTTKDTPNTDG